MDKTSSISGTLVLKYIHIQVDSYSKKIIIISLMLRGKIGIRNLDLIVMDQKKK